MALVFPPNPAIGDQLTGPFGEVYEWDGVKWTLVPGGAGGGGSGVVVDDTPPANPSAGNLWWDTVSIKLYQWTGDEWVIVVNTPFGGGASGASGSVGVTDGSDAPAGDVGEYLSWSGSPATTPDFTQPQASATILAETLPPGDWEVNGSLSVALLWPAGDTHPAACLGLYSALLLAGSVTLICGGPLAILYQTGAMTAQINVVVGPMRISTAVDQAVSLMMIAAGLAQDSAGTPYPPIPTVQVSATMNARRMR